eukprot:1007221-Rhodomonas_salina.1
MHACAHAPVSEVKSGGRVERGESGLKGALSSDAHVLSLQAETNTLSPCRPAHPRELMSLAVYDRNGQGKITARALMPSQPSCPTHAFAS